MTIYRENPDQNLTGWPSGIKYIVGNEGCERFSFYGMNAILYIYCAFLFISSGMSEKDSANMAISTVHLFKTGVYALPMIGAIIADRLLGKYNTIIWLSVIYCLGHLALSLGENSLFGLYAGLSLIAIGSGGIKPCVSATVGDQFGKSNWHLLERVYQIFYFMINFGSFFAVLFIPLVQKWYGWKIAFFIPGVLMCIATILFFRGRKHFVHVPPKPGGYLGLLDAFSSILLFSVVGSLFITASLPLWVILVVSSIFFVSGLLLFFYRQRLAKDDGFLAVAIFIIKEWLLSSKKQKMLTVSSKGAAIGGFLGACSTANEKFGEEAVEGVKAVVRIMSVFIMVSVFWALFDQHASSWIRQAEMMNRHVYFPFLGSVELLSSQIPSLNPIMVMMLIPFWALCVEPSLKKIGIILTPLKKMTLGMSLASLSFLFVAWLQMRIDNLEIGQVAVLWQIIPYLLITISEVLVSITGLEFAYSQAPVRMKSTVMGFWLLTVAFGNVLVALLARFSALELKNFFLVFAGLMAITAALFAIRTANYHVRDYTQ